MTGCGTVPEQTAVGGAAQADMTVSGLVDGVSVDAPHEIVDCGMTPNPAGIGTQAASETTLDCSAEGFTVSAPLCNTKRCGQ